MQCDQAELAEEEKRLQFASLSGQNEAATAEKVDIALRSEKSAVKSFQIVGNYLFPCSLFPFSLTTPLFGRFGRVMKA